MRKQNCMTLQRKYRNENNNFADNSRLWSVGCWLLHSKLRLRFCLISVFTCRQTNTAKTHKNDVVKFFEPLTESLFCHNFNASAHFEEIHWKFRSLSNWKRYRNWRIEFPGQIVWLYLREQIWRWLKWPQCVCIRRISDHETISKKCNGSRAVYNTR